MTNTTNYKPVPQIPALDFMSPLGMQKPTNTPTSTATLPVRPVALNQKALGDQAIYIACLASYNRGILHGFWMDLSYVHDEDDIQECIDYVLATSSVKDAEEYAFHDSQGLPSSLRGEYIDLDKVVEFIEAFNQCNRYDTDEREAYLLYCDNERGNIADYDEFRESWQGKFKGFNPGETYAEDKAEECGDLKEIPSCYRYHIDWESVWRELDTDGYWEKDGHVFAPV